MKRKKYKRFIHIALIALVAFSCSTDHSRSEKPNIILILSDDMGYSDLGCYGGEIQTPNLDRLAENGLRFTQFYNTARCCPTRASLLTGLHPHQTGIGHMTNPPENPLWHDYGVAGYRGFLNRNCITIAEALKTSGYQTMMSGKWHLGYSGKEKWPRQRGFDRFYGITSGACNFFKPEYPRGITLDNDTINITDPDYYTTDAFTEMAMEFIGESLEDSDQPFFLYLAYNAPHWPLNAPAEDIEKYRGKYMKGWEKLRDERYQKMIEMGLIDPEWELTPQDSRDWDSLDEEKKVEMDLRMAIYAAMVDRMDQNIGKLIAYLEETNELDNTVIMFLNDNGACAEFAELGSGPAKLLGTKKGYVLSYGRAWANASNTPYREYKHWLHEGGMATPFIVHWPEGIPAESRGSLISEYGFLPDIMSTCLELGQTDYPETYNGNTLHPLEGQSLVSLFNGVSEPVHTKPIFWEHEGNKAVRYGKYKLVQKWDPQAQDNWELYDMETDRTELYDLSDSLTEKRSEMIGYYKEWAENTPVMSWEEIQGIRKELKLTN